MKLVFRYIFILLLLMFVRFSCVQAQSTDPDEICVGTTKSYWVDATEGSTYLWAINGVAQTGSAASIEIIWNQPGEFVLSVQETNTSGCAGETRTLEVTVIDNLPVSVSIESSASVACEGSEVQFTAIAVNVGSNPLFVWIVNGNILPGENNATLNLIMTEDVVVQAIVTTELECVLNNPATSNSMEVVMTDELFVDVSIVAEQQFVCEGTDVTVTAIAVNGGSNPVFTWYLNGEAVAGETDPVLAFTPTDGDVVFVSLLSQDDCTINNPATSNSLSFGVQSIPVISASGNDPAFCNEPGLINFLFEDVADGVYDITYTTGVFESVPVIGESANVQALPGFYENLAILVNGCVSTDDPDVLINNLEGPVIEGISSDDPSCNIANGNISINASGEGQLQFSINGGSDWQDEPLFENLPEGTYFVFVQDALACVTEYIANPVTLTNEGGAEIALVEAGNPNCGNDNGQISINASGEGQLQFSINGGSDWQDEPLFENLPEGTYFVFVQDALACVTEYIANPVTLTNEGGAEIALVEAGNPNCGNDNGQISINASGEGQLQFSINGGSDWQDEPLFENLPEGTYFVFVQDEAGCVTDYALNPLELQQEAGPQFLEVATQDARCGLNNGTIDIVAQGGTGFTEFSIDGGLNWQTNPDFSTLVAGVYFVSIRDQNQCLDIWENNPVIIHSPEAVSIAEVIISDAGCHENDGSIEIITNNIPFDIYFSADNGYTWQENVVFDGLAVGFYSIWVSDENQCESEFGNNPVEIKRQCSDLFVLPNAFSPNGDGLNDHFGPVWVGNKPVEYSLTIFNNWGEMLFNTDNPDKLWDGSYKGTTVPAGTYAYKVYLRFAFERATGKAAEEIHGTVKVIR